MVPEYPSSRELMEHDPDTRQMLAIFSVSIVTIFLAAFKVSFPELWIGYLNFWMEEFASTTLPVMFRNAGAIAILTTLEVSGALVAMLTEDGKIYRLLYLWIIVQSFLLTFAIGRGFAG